MRITAKPQHYRKLYEAVLLQEKITLDPSILTRLAATRKKITKLIEQGVVIYGLNTGFGALSTQQISPDDITKLQDNLIMSHAVGVGKPFPEEIVRTIMVLIINYLVKGASGVRPVIVQTLVAMVNKGVIPIVPEKGSVGSSGDLAPSAHIMLVLAGKGEALYAQKRMQGKEAMSAAGIQTVTFQAKEGLALINNTATMTANAIAALDDACYLADLADIAGALSAEAIRATDKAFDKKIHDLKPYPGQILVGSRLRKLLRSSTMLDRKRIQDQYSIRCIPQVHGAVREAIRFAEEIITIETNAVTDNPLIFHHNDDIEVLSGGNFHGEAVAIAMDTVRLAVCELGNIADRRIASLLDSHHNFGLPAFLANNPGLNSGMMILQYTTASLVSENKILAHPAVVDSIPTSANIEDLVSMGTISARKTREVLENIQFVLAIELLVSCQAIEFRLKDGYTLGKGTGVAYKKVRKKVPFYESDQEYTNAVETIIHMIQKREL